MFQWLINWTGMTPDQLFQIITLLITGIIGIYTIRQQARVKRVEAEAERVKAEAQARLENIENNQIKAQAEADQMRMINANMKDLIAGMVDGNKQWQLVVSTQSERRHEDVEHLSTVMDKVHQAIDRNSVVVGNLTEMLEIQSDQLGNMDKTVAAVGAKVETTMGSIAALAQDNRTDLTTALTLSVQHQTKTDNTLETILQAVNRVAREVNTALTQKEDGRQQTLLAIKNELQVLTEQIKPRPAVLGTPKTDELKKTG